MKEIGFIGVGVMGRGMIRNLMQAGHRVSVYSRTKAKADEVIREGAIWCDSAAQCAKNKDAVITMVGFPEDVREVYFGEGAILANVKPGAYLIDMTTTSPKLSKEIHEAAKKKGVFALDAPVSGGDVGAKNGTLSIMAGGDREAFEACRELLEAMGKKVVYEGSAGSGQHTKMANQIAVAGVLAGLSEAITYARAAGLDVETMLSSVCDGAAGSWQMTNTAPRILEGDFAPGFYIKHFIKDMEIAAAEASERGLRLEALATTLSMYRAMASRGQENLGTQALVCYYENPKTL